MLQSLMQSILKNNIEKTGYLGRIGLYCFALGTFLSPPLGTVGFGLMSLALGLRFKLLSKLRRDGLVLLSLAFGLFLLLRTTAAVSEWPATRTAQINEALDLFRLGFFFAVVTAIWIAEDPQAIRPLLLLAFSGLLLKMVLKADINDLPNYLANRPGFGMPANAFGLYAAVAVLGLLLLPHRLARQFRGWYFIAAAAAWLVALFLFCGGLVATQSRSAFLACLMVLPIVFGIRMVVFCKRRGEHGGKHLIVIAISVVFIFAVIAVITRLSIGRRIVSPFFAAEGVHSMEKLSPDSIAIFVRYDLWRLALKKWTHRPIIGWGPGSVEEIITRSNIDSIRLLAEKGEIFRDFHNSLLQVLVQIGLMGVFFFAFALWLFLRWLWRAYHWGWIDLELYLFVMGAVAMFFVSTSFNLRTGDVAGRHFVTLIGGIAYAFRYRVLLFENSKMRGGENRQHQRPSETTSW
jgi:O-antigen ligase